MAPRPRYLLLDVDNTLYPRERGIVQRIDARIDRYIVERLGLGPEEADQLRRRLWAEHGTTLTGLMAHYDIDPRDYLEFVHAIGDLAELLGEDRALGAMLARLPIVKIAFTNAPLAHARAVLERLGVRAQFAAIYGIERLGYAPKPGVQAYQRVLAGLGAGAPECILADDRPENLRTARELGMHTVLVDGRDVAADGIADVVIGSVHELEAVLVAQWRIACG